jgi:hypothetical protein
MQTQIKLVVGSLCLLITSACAMASKQPVTGFIYSDVTDATMATSNPVGTKKGEACSSSILGAYASGDSSIEAARRNGSITQITSVDTKTPGILGAYATSCTIVHGK